MSREILVCAGEGRFELQASVSFVGDDLSVVMEGGERPHIGAVAVAQPRPSLVNPQRISASASVICLTGHKEDEVARGAALRLASELNRVVVVSAGMHWDDLDVQGIAVVETNVEHLTEQVLEAIGDLGR